MIRTLLRSNLQINVFLFLVIVIIQQTAAPPVCAQTIYNPDFEADDGAFIIPSGWTPFGEGGYEGYWENGNWRAQTADPPPLQSAGLYQVISGIEPGVVYRLTAEARGGGEQSPTRIGLVPRASARLEDAVWSADHVGTEWAQLSVESVAEVNAITILLEFRNRNAEHYLIARGAWDNVALVPVGKKEHPALTLVRTPKIPPATDSLASLANLWSLAYPRTGVKTFMAGTHDPDREGNRDFSRFEGHFTEDGKTWTVLKSFTGPGAIVRIWMTEFRSLENRPIRIEVDGVIVYVSPVREFFGTPGPFRFPLTNRTSGGWMCYTPIPFRESARISLLGDFPNSFYWQINWQQYDSGADVRSFTLPLPAEDAALLREIEDQWSAAGLDPKPPWPGSRSRSRSLALKPGQRELLWSARGAGMVSAIRIAAEIMDETRLQGLRLRMAWDSARTPQVDVPLGLFCGTGYQPVFCRGLLAGMTPGGDCYIYYPMPFRNGARIELVNSGGGSVLSATGSVEWVSLPEKQVSPLRFHAQEERSERAGENGLFNLLKVRGRGHFMGLSAAMSSGNVQDVHYLEGDEYIWVDGAPEPVWAGTGTEDYFTCGWYFFAGPITLAPIGAPVVDRDNRRISAYRQHLSDWVPFTESLELGLEVGGSWSSPEYGNYQVVSVYYGE